jgi:hypothetical protein
MEVLLGQPPRTWTSEGGTPFAEWVANNSHFPGG